MDTRLFDEDLVALPHGPVVISVYEAYKSYGDRPIEDVRGGSVRRFRQDRDTQEILEQVWNAFGCCTASKLRNMTCSERPWKEAAEKRMGEYLNPVTLREYFDRHYTRDLDECEKV